MIRKYLQNPFILFFPFLIFYLILVILFPTAGTAGDQDRYLIYAQFMINGQLPLNKEFVLLGNGPGYSLIIIPFVFFKFSFITITVLNAILYYMSVVFLFKSLIRVAHFKISLILSLFWGLYYNLYEQIVVISPEVFVTFLIVFLIYFILKLFSEINYRSIRINLMITGIIIGFIALVKPIFGYVIMITFIFSIILFILNKKSSSYKKLFLCLSIALIITIPYLAFTFQQTGKVFYWSSLGGNNLYWMASPYKSDLGDWFPDINRISKFARDADLIKGAEDSLIKNHKDNFSYILQFDDSKRDEAYKKIAIENIKNNPTKYLQNIINNAGRILFNYPYSYRAQKASTLFRLPLNGLIVSFCLLALLPTIVNWKKIIFPIRFLLFFVFIYLGGSVLVSAETRMFSIIVPILLIWMAFIFNKSIKYKIGW